MDEQLEPEEGQENFDQLPDDEGKGLDRRDFLKIAAVLTGSMLLMLGRLRPGDDPGLPDIPPDFKRFILTRPSPTVATERIITALGSQCPDLSCALWTVDDQEFQFFETIDQINTLYALDGRNELYWLD